MNFFKLLLVGELHILIVCDMPQLLLSTPVICLIDGNSYTTALAVVTRNHNDLCQQVHHSPCCLHHWSYWLMTIVTPKILSLTPWLIPIDITLIYDNISTTPHVVYTIDRILVGNANTTVLAITKCISLILLLVICLSQLLRVAPWFILINQWECVCHSSCCLHTMDQSIGSQYAYHTSCRDDRKS